MDWNKFAGSGPSDVHQTICPSMNIVQGFFFVGKGIFSETIRHFFLTFSIEQLTAHVYSVMVTVTTGVDQYRKIYGYG